MPCRAMPCDGQAVIGLDCNALHFGSIGSNELSYSFAHQLRA